MVVQIGKDRTGLIGALVLAVCGATDIEIISDYARCGLACTTEASLSTALPHTVIAVTLGEAPPQRRLCPATGCPQPSLLCRGVGMPGNRLLDDFPMNFLLF